MSSLGWKEIRGEEQRDPVRVSHFLSVFLFIIADKIQTFSHSGLLPGQANVPNLTVA